MYDYKFYWSIYLLVGWKCTIIWKSYTFKCWIVYWQGTLVLTCNIYFIHEKNLSDLFVFSTNCSMWCYFEEKKNPTNKVRHICLLRICQNEFQILVITVSFLLGGQYISERYLLLYEGWGNVCRIVLKVIFWAYQHILNMYVFHIMERK